ncbi:hypothetical protein [Helicobacter sp. T3_23-1056]
MLVIARFCDFVRSCKIVAIHSPIVIASKCASICVAIYKIKITKSNKSPLSQLSQNPKYPPQILRIKTRQNKLNAVF